jgi:WbqC-like protein family
VPEKHTVVVNQPSYIPWRGYFDLIRRADTFVFYDDVQFDKHGWRNRNRIKTPGGLSWLSIPVHARGAVSEHLTIDKIEIDDRSNWRRKHLESIRHAYSRAPYFEETMAFLAAAFDRRTGLLADFTIDVTEKIARRLGLRASFRRSSGITVAGSKTDRLVATLAALGATHYISGPAARAYIQPEQFAEAGIALEYIDYDYAPYPQLHGPFEPQTSIVDLLMMTGDEAPLHLLPRD